MCNFVSTFSLMLKSSGKILKAHIAILIVNIIYGANFSIAKTVMPSHIKPIGFILIRVVIALALFFLISPLIKTERLDKKDLLRLILCGLFGVAINQMLFFKGLALTYPINGAIIMTATPILVLIIAATLIKEKVTFRKALGIILGTSGALALLVFGKEISFNSDTFLGDIYIFINAVSYGIFLVIAKPLMKKYHPITVIKWTFLFGTIFVVPFGIKEFQEIQWELFSSYIWMNVAYVVIGTTFLAYLLNTIALESLSPSVVSIYIYIQPILVASIALVAGNDQLTLIKIVSSFLIFLGVYLVSTPIRYLDVK